MRFYTVAVSDSTIFYAMMSTPFNEAILYRGTETSCQIIVINLLEAWDDAMNKVVDKDFMDSRLAKVLASEIQYANKPSH